MNLQGKPIIQVIEIAHQKYMAQSIYNDVLTSEILFTMAKQYLKQAAVAEHEQKKRKEGKIIDPNTGYVISGGNNNN